MTFGEKLKALRQENAIDVAYFCEKFGVCRQTLYCWETGKKKPSCKYIRAIAQYFKVNVKDLTSKE